jgi:adenosylcobinamide-GDP ribazoletransferase
MVGVSTILIRSVALACLPIRPLLVALLVIPAWARWCETYAIGRFPYLKKQGKGKIWHDTTQFPGDIYKAALAPFITTLVLLCSGMHIALLVSALTILAGVAAAHWLNHKLGGQTGDTYGAVVELSETVALLAMALLIQPAIF